jgi:acetyl esterase/lipase
MRFVVQRILRSPWASIIVGLLLIIAGVVLLGRVFDSIIVLVYLASAASIIIGAGFALNDKTMVGRILAVGAGTIGALGLVLSDTAIPYLSLALSIILLIRGLNHLREFLTRPASRNVSNLFGGVALIGFGIASLAWRDLSTMVLGLLTGPALIASGIWCLHRAGIARGLIGGVSSLLSGRKFRTGGAVICALLAIGSLVGTASIQSAVPDVSAFYSAPASFPESPGQLVRQGDFTSDLPDNSRAWKILYTTPAIDGSPGVGSAMVYQPTNAGDGPFPVILWVHGTVGVAQECGPSLRENPLTSGAALAFEQVLAKGWAIVMPDYLGLGTEAPHPYLVGPPTAQSSLNALRAAYQTDGASLGDQTVVWGHSQGGATALWVGIESLTYAPELDLIGVVALSPATDLPVLADSLSKSSLGRFFSSFILEGYSTYYDDIRMSDYIRPAALGVYQAIAGRCLESRASVISFTQAALDDDIFSQSIDSGPLRDRLDENVPRAITGLPTFIGQGLDDGLILPDVQRAFAEHLCTNGQVVEYTGYAGYDHLTVVEDDSPLVPDVIAWTEARFAGAPAASSCSFQER